MLALMGNVVLAATDLPASLTWRDVGYGDVLADATGATLYVSDRDREIGKTGCTGTCTERWRPVAAPAGFMPTGEWSVIQRDDGVRQLANRNKALYTSVLDKAPGEMNGDGVEGGWRVLLKPLRLPPGFKVESERQAQLLADGAGVPLYVSDGDQAGKITCVGVCTELWSPVAAPAVAVVKGDWSTVERPDGIRQWTYRNRPLYRFAGTGKLPEPTPASTGWQPVVLRPAPPVPAEFTVRESMHGPVFADRHGMTVYGYFSAPEKMKSACDDTCLRTDWKPVLAGPYAKASGRWTLVTREDGAQQWAYNGHPLFTSVRDSKPGDVRAIRYGYGGGNRDGNWQPIQPTS